MRKIKRIVSENIATKFLKGSNGFQFVDRVTKLVSDCLDQINEFYDVLSTVKDGKDGNQGPQGPKGDKGDKGLKGDNGEGVPEGGTIGQVLQKKSDNNFDTEWINPPASGVSSVNGKTGDVTLDASDVNALPDTTPIPAEVNEQTVAEWGFTKNTGNYNKPNSGIPSTDFADDVQTSLGKADTALQTQKQADWNESDTDDPAFIKNKPTIPDTSDCIKKSSTAGLVKNDGTIDTNTYLTQNDISGKADKSEMSVTDGTGTDSDKTTIQLKSGTSATVLKNHQSLSGKQDVIDAQHTLDADLVDDTNSTNKFTNATEKQTWNNKQDALDFETAPSSTNKVTTMADVPIVPNNIVVFSNDNGEGIIPSDGIRAEQVNAGATISVNADVVTVVSGNVGTSAITLQVPNDNLAHVWDILMTTDSSVAITLAMSNSETILYPDGFGVGASKNVEISVIGVGTKYYLRYGEFA